MIHYGCKFSVLLQIFSIVDDISSLWAMERGDIYNGKYHITGGILSAVNGVEPIDLNLAGLVERVKNENIKEVILALPATIDAKITSHYIINLLSGVDVKITELMQGIPIGGELKETLNNSNANYSVLTYKTLIFEKLRYHQYLAT